jgi:hypothetical protein
MDGVDTVEKNENQAGGIQEVGCAATDERLFEEETFCMGDTNGRNGLAER